MNKTIITTLLASLLTCNVHASDWGYDEHTGPEYWGKISKTCETGKNQSPINISETVQGEMQSLNLDYDGKVIGMINNGHTLQAKVEGKNTLTVDNKMFELKQFHFHTPSENLIHNKQYPLEAHFVHVDKEGNLAVVSVMFEIDKPNSQITKLSTNLPEEGEATTLIEPFAISEMLPTYNSYYRFNGSLTTPPCSEGVRWFILSETKTLSTNQEETLNKAMGNNNRPIQDIYARKVMFNKS
ncbi:carbonic anhydrase [Vibrio sp. HN007]|uniref:carbonic anhydrase n=1 Tax=Vibrio iocasae TaxID=3098914 RepID=UPI0035D46CDC